MILFFHVGKSNKFSRMVKPKIFQTLEFLFSPEKLWLNQKFSTAVYLLQKII